MRSLASRVKSSGKCGSSAMTTNREALLAGTKSGSESRLALLRDSLTVSAISTSMNHELW